MWDEEAADPLPPADPRSPGRPANKPGRYDQNWDKNRAVNYVFDWTSTDY